MTSINLWARISEWKISRGAVSRFKYGQMGQKGRNCHKFQALYQQIFYFFERLFFATSQNRYVIFFLKSFRLMIIRLHSPFETNWMIVPISWSEFRSGLYQIKTSKVGESNLMQRSTRLNQPNRFEKAFKKLQNHQTFKVFNFFLLETQSLSCLSHVEQHPFGLSSPNC